MIQILTEETYQQHALEIKKAMKAVREIIPQDIFGKNMLLSAEDYRAIANGIVIQANKKGKGGNGQGNYEGKATEPQLKLILKIVNEVQDGQLIVAGFLDANGVKTIDELTSSLASSLIDTLKGSPKRK